MHRLDRAKVLNQHRVQRIARSARDFAIGILIKVVQHELADLVRDMLSS